MSTAFGLRDRRLVNAARADDRRASLSHGTQSLESRLTDRCDRLRLVILALAQRVREHAARHDAVPEPLLAAVRQFQTDLASASADLRATVSRPQSGQPASRATARREPAKETP